MPWRWTNRAALAKAQEECRAASLDLGRAVNEMSAAGEFYRQAVVRTGRDPLGDQ